MFYMVNPSKLPAKRRRNPELLIVNPYGGKSEKKGKKMAKRKLRKNPLKLLKEVADKEDLQNAAAMGIAGGAAMTLGIALVGARAGDSALARTGVGVAGGLLGSVLLTLASRKVPGKAGAAMKYLAPKVAAGALTLGVWELAKGPVTDLINKGRAMVGLQGWTKEFEGWGLGQSYYDEFTPGVSPGSKGIAGFAAGPNPVLDPSDNPFLESGSLSAYEPLGDVYNTQRLGSFEAESGLGSFHPEEANVMHQQIADQAKHQAGFYGGLGAATLFEPFIHD